MAKNKVHIDVTGDSTKAVNALQKVQRQQDRTIDGLKKMSRASKGAKGSSEGLLGSLTGFIGAGAIIGGVTMGLREMVAEAQRGAETLNAGAPGNKRLIQVATDAADLKQLQSKRDALRKHNGMDEEVATNLVFGARSYGMEEDLGTFQKVDRFSDSVAMMTSVQKLRKNFGKGAGNTKESINKILKAGETSGLTVEDIGMQALQAAPAWANNKWSDESLLASMSVGEGGFKSAEEAATGLKAFATIASKEDAGNSFGKAMEHFRRMEANNPKKFKELMDSNVRFKAGYSTLRNNYGDIRQTLGAVQKAEADTGTDESMLRKRHDLWLNDPESQAAFKSRKAKQRVALAERDKGYEAIEIEDVKSKEVAKSLQKQEHGLVRSVRKASMATAEMLGASPEKVQRASGFVPAMMSFGITETPELANKWKPMGEWGDDTSANITGGDGGKYSDLVNGMIDSYAQETKQADLVAALEKNTNAMAANTQARQTEQSVPQAQTNLNGSME